MQIPPADESYAALVAEFRAGRKNALARVVSIVENRRRGFEQILGTLAGAAGRAHRTGITGPPGAGKSTLCAALAASFRAAGETVGMVAVDPTSPFTGGALLGDRIRLNDVALDDGVFIRSMATRGSLGGLAITTKEIADVFDAFGFDRILIETVGVGQSELDVAAAADTTVVVLVPESGDSIQAMKAGLMEISDVFIVNKADRPGALRLARDIETMLHLRGGEALRNVPAHHGVDLRRGAVPHAAASPPRPDGPRPWSIPVLQTVAETGEGMAAVLDALAAHRAWLAATGGIAQRRRRRLEDRVREAVARELQRRAWHDGDGEAILQRCLPEMERGDLTPYQVAARIVRAVAG
jgi:LAO/AO transport system kinase